MKIYKVLIIGLGLLLSALLALVASANNDLEIKVMSVVGADTVRLQLLYYDETKKTWIVETNFDKVKTGDEISYERKNPPPYLIEVISDKSLGYCRNSQDTSSQTIGDFPEVIIDEIDVTKNTCFFTVPQFELTMNFYVYGLTGGQQATFEVRQFDSEGEIENVEKSYSFINTWPTSEMQVMELGYLYSEIWHEGDACKFESGENPTRVGTDISNVHIKFNKDEGNGCVLSEEAFPAPVELETLKIKVNISGIRDDYATPAALNYTTFTENGEVINSSNKNFYCNGYGKGCRCSDNTAPVDGFCTEEILSYNLGSETIRLTWSRIKEGFVPVTDVCELDGSAMIEQNVVAVPDGITADFDVYGSDPSQAIYCEIK